MSMDKLKTDGDIMVYLRNVRRSLQEIAQQTGQSIHMEISPDGYARAIIGGYEAAEYPSELGDDIEYRPALNLKVWQEVVPQQIRFGKEPVSRKDPEKCR